MTDLSHREASTLLGGCPLLVGVASMLGRLFRYIALTTERLTGLRCAGSQRQSLPSSVGKSTVAVRVCSAPFLSCA
jgi:hypothetical protein